MVTIFIIAVAVVFWAMVGYPFFLLLLEKILDPSPMKKDYLYEPSVTIMVVAHNEEKVIVEKLKNLCRQTYPKEKLEILVTSDHSTDKTNALVEKFIQENKTLNITLFKVENRGGKTNAQNEAQKIVKSEVLVMTDANAMLHADAVKELVSSFSEEDIKYVCGKLVYINELDNNTANSESSYWKMDLKLREIESKFQTITAGNGALYAIKNEDYVDFKPIESHDSSMPLHFGMRKERALYNNEAIAYEKAGEASVDEFSRKVRMNRRLLQQIIPSWDILNIFEFKWFSIFYFGHRTCRYLLWLAHSVILISTAILAFKSLFFQVVLLLHAVAFIAIFLYWKGLAKNKIVRLIFYYFLTVWAQIMGVIISIKGNTSPFWEKAETTR